MKEVRDLYDNYSQSHDIDKLNELSDVDLENEFQRRDNIDRFYIESLKTHDNDKTTDKTDNNNSKRVEFTKIISRPANFAGQSEDFLPVA